MRARYAAVFVVVTGALLACPSPGALGAEPKLYWAEDEGAIKRSNLDGSDIETVIETRDDEGKNGQNFAYLAADPASKKLFYAIGSPTPQLWSADFDGGDRQLLATFDSANYVRGLAFDQPSKQLYWTSFHGYRAGNGKIRTADADGSNVRDVLSLSDGYPYGMAIDRGPGLMFWANTEQGTLERAKLDGTGRQVIATGGVSFTTQLAVDSAANRVYWTDVDDLKIHWADYDGGNAGVIESPGSPYAAYDSGIAVYHPAGYLFWSDTASDRIFRSDLDGSNVTPILSTGSNTTSLVVVHNPEPSAAGILISVLTGGAMMRRRPR